MSVINALWIQIKAVFQANKTVSLIIFALGVVAGALLF